MHENKSNPSDAPARKRGLALDMVPGRFAICRLEPGRVPGWAFRGDFVAIARSPDELSIVCEERHVPQRVRAENGWAAIRVAGTLDLSLIGVLASLAVPLAEARIGLFTVSTFDTDYLLVRAGDLERAKRVLENAGHAFGVARRNLAAAAGPAVAEDLADLDDEEDDLDGDDEDDDLDDDDDDDEDDDLDDDDDEDDDLDDDDEDDDEDDLDDDDEDDLDDDEDDLDDDDDDDDLDEDDDDEDDLDDDLDDDAGAEAADDYDFDAPDDLDDDDIEGQDLATGAIPQDDLETTELTFADLGLSQMVLDTITRVGFLHPTPIQAAVVPEALRGKDLVGLAETGSGKTAAFVLPLAERLTHGRGTRGLILCPTREIALQTKAFLDLVGQGNALETVCVIGGVRIGPQIDRLREEPDIVVATPGRLLDHVERRTVRLGSIEFLVLDEADHMLDLGFLPQIQAVLQTVPAARQTMLFSATMPPPIARLADRFMNDPVRIDFRPAGRIAAGIEHRLYLVAERDKLATLEALLGEVEGSTLVFTRRKIEAEFVSRQLQNAGLRAERLHSDRSQAQRVKALRAFRAGKNRVLVATDVAARGLDIPRIEHVVNYDLPEIVEDYVHRAGRTARGSAAGIVSSISTWKDKITIREIERAIGLKLPRRQAEGVKPYVELQKRKVIRRRLL